jgi:hypothetical protein
MVEACPRKRPPPITARYVRIGWHLFPGDDGRAFELIEEAHKRW